jgi:hypothetical protein
MRYIKYFNELNEAIINASNYSEKDEPENYGDEDSSFQRKMRLKEAGKKIKQAYAPPADRVTIRDIDLKSYSPLKYTDVPLDVYLKRKKAGTEESPSIERGAGSEISTRKDDIRKKFEDKVNYIFDIFEKCPIEDFKNKYFSEYKFIMVNYRNSYDLKYMKDILDKFEIQMAKEQRAKDLTEDKRREEELANWKKENAKRVAEEQAEYMRKAKELYKKDMERMQYDNWKKNKKAKKAREARKAANKD